MKPPASAKSVADTDCGHLHRTHVIVSRFVAIDFIGEMKPLNCVHNALAKPAGEGIRVPEKHESFLLASSVKPRHCMAV
jgi:hypothetical protein